MESATVSTTLIPEQSDDSTISTAIPLTLVLLMIVCTVVVIILVVRWRVARKQVDTALEHKGKHANDSSKVPLSLPQI